MRSVEFPDLERVQTTHDYFEVKTPFGRATCSNSERHVLKNELPKTRAGWVPAAVSLWVGTNSQGARRYAVAPAR